MKTRPALRISASIISTAVATLLQCGLASADSVSVPDPKCGDVNNSGAVTTSDALAVLRKSVGAPNTLICATCPAVVVYGNTTEIPETSFYRLDYLLGTAVQITQAGQLTNFGMIAREEGTHAKMALYTDVAGNPGTLVIGTDAFTVLDGAQSIAVAATAVTPGTYWLMAVYDADTDSPGTDLDETTIHFRELPFGSPLPLTFGVPETYVGNRNNYTIKVLP